MAGSKPNRERGPHRWTKETAPRSPGRPPKAAEQDYLAAIKRAVTAEDMQAVAAKALEQAKRGDKYAREWLSRQFGTEAAQKIAQEVRQVVVEAPLPVEGDPELEGLVRDLAARIFGPKAPPVPTNGSSPHPA